VTNVLRIFRAIATSEDVDPQLILHLIYESIADERVWCCWKIM